jgi:hypothetical protein
LNNLPRRGSELWSVHLSSPLLGWQPFWDCIRALNNHVLRASSHRAVY